MKIVKKEVELNGVKLTGIRTQEGKIYIVVKTFCEILGLDPSGQLQRIKRDETLREGMGMMPIPTESGKQEMTLLELDFLPMWLTGIRAERCKEEIRPYLKEFKLKAKDILADAFLGKRKEITQFPVRYNPYLNDTEDRTPILRNIETKIKNLYAEIDKLNQLRLYHYEMIKWRASEMIDFLVTPDHTKDPIFTSHFLGQNDEILTISDIDKLNNKGL